MPTVDELLESLRSSIEELDTTAINFKGMIYGPSGVGKTVESVRLAQMLCPAGKSILYVDAVEGWVALRNHDDEKLTSNVSRMVYDSVFQLTMLGNAIAAKVEPFDKIGVLIFDELSTMSKKDLDVVLHARSKKDPSKDPDIPTQPDFFANTERMRRLTMELLKLPIHVIVVSHMRIDKNQKTGVETDSPAFMPKFAETIKENLHIVARMNADERIVNEETVYIRSLQVHPTKSVVAKSRVKFDGIIVGPDTFNTTIASWVSSPEETTVDEQEVIDDESITVAVTETDDISI